MKTCTRCGETAADSATECPNCGNPFAGSIHSDNQVLKLTNIRSRQSMELSGEFIIGSGTGLDDFLGGDDFVRYISDDHCRLFREDRDWVVEDHHSLNGTFLNRTRLEPFTPVIIRDNSLLRVGKNLFLIRFENAGNTGDEGLDEFWEVVCPCCGKRYEVDGPDSRIDVCSGCEDNLDSRRIRGVPPKRSYRRN